MANIRKYTDTELREAVSVSCTWAEVCRRVGVVPMTGSQTHLKKKALALGIDVSAMKGKRYSKGTIKPSTWKPLEAYLNNEAPIKSHELKKRLIRSGLKEAKCESCGITEWLGDSSVFELDHINSNHFDNRLDNLQIVCPNCHLIITRRRKNIKGEVA